MSSKRQSNADYNARTRDRIILRDRELRPSTFLELLDCLGDFDRRPADKRADRLTRLYIDLTGKEPPITQGDD